MKRIFTWISLFAALLATVPSFGQITYGHEWIDFSNPNPYFKIKVAETGVYRIDYNAFGQALSESGHNINLIDPREIQVFYRGEQIPIYIFGESNGQFNTSDFIEFVGEKNDGWLDKELYEYASNQPNKYYSNFTDTAAYFLTWNNDPAQQHLRYAEQANDLTNLPAKENYFMHTEVREFHNSWHGGKSRNQQGVYLYDSRFETGEGYMLNPFNKSSTTQNINVKNIYSSGPAATVRTNMVSIYHQVHRTRFSINGSVIADTTYGTVGPSGGGNGEFVFPLVNQVPLGVFKNNGQPDEFKYEALGTGSSDRQSIGYIEVQYPHTYDFDNVPQFGFKVFGTAGNSKYLEITNFDHQGQPPVLFDVFNRQRIEGIVSGSTVQFKVPFNTTGEAELFLVAAPEVKGVSALSRTRFIDFSESANQGNYLLISGKALRDDGQGNDWVEQYEQYRESANGGGWNVTTINAELLFDQFAYGIAKHPLSIRHFVQYALDSFQTVPQHLFLVGKALEYNLARTDANRYKQNVVPTFGHPGSDMLMTTRGFHIAPKISVGRLAARNGTQIRIYLDKVKALEQNQRSASVSVSDKAWTKRVLHFGGGNNASEQNIFRQYLGDYEKIIADSFYGAEVHGFFKTSPDPIQYLQSQYIDSLINDGASLITFFGHSTANAFDVNIDDPANFENYGKYPLIMSNGCFSGQIHGTSSGISEKFIFEQDKGAIGFLASTTYGERTALHRYSDRFYKNLSRQFYDEDIGTVIMHTVRYYADSTGAGEFLEWLCQNNTLHGDPAIKLNTHQKPDYAVEAPMIGFHPKEVTVDRDSFEVQVLVQNLGRAQDESLTVELRRQFSDGSIELKSRTIQAPNFSETLTFRFYTDPVRGINQNRFTVDLDPESKLDELTRMNNSASTDLFIKSKQAFPVYPYAYSIVKDPNLSLKSSTANALAEEQEYIIQIDTTEEFNSLTMRSTTLHQGGGILEWENVPITLQDEQVYYWRVSPAFSHPDSAQWNSSSFVYVQDGSPGWNQSHYYQFLPAYYANIELTSQRNFKFVDDIKQVKVTNGLSSHIYWQDVSTYYINSERISSWSCIGKGMVIAVIDSVTGLPWSDREHNFGETQCLFSQRHAFHFRTANAGQRKNVVDFLDAIPNGNYILAMSFQGYEYKQYNADTLVYGNGIFKKLEELGASGLMSLDTLSGTPPFVFFVQKGNVGTATTIAGDGPNIFIDTFFTVSGLWDQGYIQSLQIGPAKAYGDLSWTAVDPQNTDYISLDVIGVKPDGNKTTLLTGIQASDTNIQALSAIQYPSLELKLNVKDDSLRSAAQLRKWRVTYDPVGDVAVRPDLYYTFHHDTLQQGEELKLGVALQNITDYAMDSLLVSLHLVRSDNQREQLSLKRYKPLQPGDTVQFNFRMDTYGYSGTNVLILEANPDNDQLEQYRFNNLLSIPFEVEKDIYNPLLDVTFDGVHIMDGDIVSTNPAISIQLKDENSFLRLDDTSSMDIYIQYPTSGRKRLAYNSELINFIPANGSGNNEARVELEPVFTQDGTYLLIVRARDKTGNSAGANDYQVSFEVITRNAISNVLNYPNPFTSSTQFVFTITGSTVPDYLKIQIMTVSGKVVREVTKDELGPLHVGTNLTEFRWDGTDQYGDPLANGLYFYRVIARLTGQEMERYRLNSVDRYFESGLGKMYLAR